MNKMHNITTFFQVHFKYLHFLWYQQFIGVFSICFLHQAVLDVFKVFEYTQSYLDCHTALQSLCEPIDPETRSEGTTHAPQALSVWISLKSVRPNFCLADWREFTPSTSSHRLIPKLDFSLSSKGQRGPARKFWQSQESGGGGGGVGGLSTTPPARRSGRSLSITALTAPFLTALFFELTQKGSGSFPSLAPRDYPKPSPLPSPTTQKKSPRSLKWSVPREGRIEYGRAKREEKKSAQSTRRLWDETMGVVVIHLMIGLLRQRERRCF